MYECEGHSTHSSWYIIYLMSTSIFCYKNFIILKGIYFPSYYKIKSTKNASCDSIIPTYIIYINIWFKNICGESLTWENQLSIKYFVESYFITEGRNKRTVFIEISFSYRCTRKYFVFTTKLIRGITRGKLINFGYSLSVPIKKVHMFPQPPTYQFPQIFICQHLVSYLFVFVWPHSEFVWCRFISENQFSE